jgi:hypothetical protein
MPWKLHRVFGCGNRTSRILDFPPLPIVSHKEWRAFSHSPLGIALLKALYGEGFSVGEALSHIVVDTVPYKKRRLLAKMID